MAAYTPQLSEEITPTVERVNHLLEDGINLFFITDIICWGKEILLWGTKICTNGQFIKII